MKTFTTTIFALLTALQAFSQITITTSDMPSVGDTFRISNGLITPAIDPIPAGAAFTWDFSMLQWISQDVDSFISVASTGPIYSIIFANLPFNPNRANLAARGPDLPSLPQVTISDVNYFYYNSSGSYEQAGYGALINGLSVPIPFDNKDRIYDFPVNFGNIDSSDSDFQLSLPGLGFYGHNQRRVNEVDGWGMLTTPFGTFNTLRIKSVINGHDSLFLDTLGLGFGLDLPQTVEYKWMGALQGIPLLQINTTVNPLGTEVVTAIRYRDSLRVISGINEVIGENHFSVSLYPNPVESILVLDLNLNRQESVNIFVYNAIGEKIDEVFCGELPQGRHQVRFDAANRLRSNAVYFIEIQSGNQRKYTPFVFTGK